MLFQLSDYFTSEQDKITFIDSLFPTFLLLHKKGPKPVVELAKLNFTSLVLLYHNTKIARTRPGFDDRPEHPSVQINSSSP